MRELPDTQAMARFRPLLLWTKKILLMLRGSKPGIAGLIIIFAFVFMAIFAPFLAPYSVSFIAPAEDMFSIERIEMSYPASDGYHTIVVGPTTPGESAMGGGMWFILANEDGTYADRTYHFRPYFGPNPFTRTAFA